MNKFCKYCFVIILLISGCGKKREHAIPVEGSYYTCPMHPSVISQSPGACPICGMKLVLVQQKQPVNQSQARNTVVIDRQKQFLAAIETDTVSRRNISSTLSVLGTVAVDQEKVQAISIRVAGRLEDLMVRAPGRYVRKGSPLYSIYSEPLLAAQKDYLALLKGSPTVPVVTEMQAAAVNRLEKMGMSAEQVSHIGFHESGFTDTYSLFAVYRLCNGSEC